MAVKKQTTVVHAPYSRRTGDLLSYAWGNPGDDGASLSPTEWRQNEEFTATLRFDCFERGRSAAHAIFRDDDGHRFPMFLRELAELMTKEEFRAGKIHGRFIVVKRGANYGTKYLGQ